MIATGDLPRGATYTVRAYSPNPQAEAAGRGRQRVPVVGRPVGDREPRGDPRVGQRPRSSGRWCRSTAGWSRPAIRPGTRPGRMSPAPASTARWSPSSRTSTASSSTTTRRRRSARVRCWRTSCCTPTAATARCTPARWRWCCACTASPRGSPYGFTEGSQTQTGYKVTDRDAHAWVEAFFPKYGWIPFEPTPTRNLPEVQASTHQRQLGAVDRRPEERQPVRHPEPCSCSGGWSAPRARTATNPATRPRLRRRRRPGCRGGAVGWPQLLPVGNLGGGHPDRGAGGCEAGRRALAVPAARPAGTGLGRLPRAGHLHRRPGRAGSMPTPPSRSWRGWSSTPGAWTRRRWPRPAARPATRRPRSPIAPGTRCGRRCAGSAATCARASTCATAPMGSLRLRSMLAQTTHLD